MALLPAQQGIVEVGMSRSPSYSSNNSRFEYANSSPHGRLVWEP